MDYNILPDDPPKPKRPDVVQALIDACNQYDGANVCKSPEQALMMELAAKHAQSQASRRRQSHDGFSDRAAKIRKAVGNLSCSEIVAESWPEQSNDDLTHIAYSLFHDWNTSPGHWRVAKANHLWWGGSMAKGVDGVWYACIITADNWQGKSAGYSVEFPESMLLIPVITIWDYKDAETS